MENIVARWPGLIILGIMTVLEFVSKCVPVLDQVIDSVVFFIVPLMSVLGTISTFGLFDHFADEAGDNEGRRLSISSRALIFCQIILICVGVCLAVSLHLFKMLVRLIGIGWLQGILTIVEFGF